MFLHFADSSIYNKEEAPWSASLVLSGQAGHAKIKVFWISVSNFFVSEFDVVHINWKSYKNGPAFTVTV